MKIVRVKKNDAEFFEDLDPFELLSLLENPTAFALGAIFAEETGGPERDISIAGLLVGTVTEEMLTIDWVAVEEEFRGQGIGEELLLTAFRMADAGDVPQIGAVFSSELSQEGLIKQATAYFTDRLFEEEQEIPGNIRITLGELEKAKLLKADPSKLPKPRALSSLTPVQVKETVKALFSLPGAEYLYAPEFGKTLISPEESFLFLDGEEPFGALLVEKGEEWMMPVLYYAESEQESTALILSSVHAGLAAGGKDQDIFLKVRKKESAAAFRRLLPEVPFSRMLTAELASYRAVKNEES